MSVEKLNSQNFDTIVKGTDKVVFVDFNATWCGPCRYFGPIFEEFSNENASKVLCGGLDIDESRDIAMRYGIQAVPTTLVFKGGEIVDSMVGASDKPTLEAKLAKHA